MRACVPLHGLRNDMDRYTILGAIAAGVLLFGAGAYWFFSPSSQPAQPGPVMATISYTDDGFVPTEVTIKKGEAVRWTNDSSKVMWPASGVHPTHSLYPEKSDSDCLGSTFDACEQLPPGMTWEFTFHEVGNWRFHDHITPSKIGIVHVTE